MICSLPPVGVTHCKDRRWKEQFTPGEMRLGRVGGLMGTQLSAAHLAFFWLYLISRMHRELAELLKNQWIFLQLTVVP